MTVTVASATRSEKLVAFPPKLDLRLGNKVSKIGILKVDYARARDLESARARNNFVTKRA